MRSDLLAMSFHKLRKPFHVLDHLDAVLSEDRYSGDKFVFVGFDYSIRIFGIRLFSLFNYFYHPPLDEHGVTRFISQPHGAHHARGHEHGDMTFFQGHDWL